MPQNASAVCPAADPALTFERFLAGASNRLGLSALTSLAAGRADWAPRGLGLIAPGPWGKTHLLTALALRAAETGAPPCLRLAVEAETVWPPSSAWPARGLVVVDDVHLLAGRPDLQQRLSQAFDAASGQRPGLVFSAPGPPGRLPGLSESLKSRLSGGLVLPLNAPDDELMLALALRRAREMGLDPPPDLAAALVRRAESDPRRLFGLVETLNFMVKQGGFSLDEALVRLGPEESPPALSASGLEVPLEDIQAGVAAAFGLKVSDLTGHSRLRQSAWPRRVAMFLARELTRLTTTEIGQAFGGRDHSTVIHALKKIRLELQLPAQRKMVENLKRSLLGPKL